MVRCKFKCTTVGKIIENEIVTGFNISFEPVYCGSKENEKFFKWTPYGSLNIGTVNVEAGKYFEEGKEYYLDLTSVEEYNELLGGTESSYEINQGNGETTNEQNS